MNKSSALGNKIKLGVVAFAKNIEEVEKLRGICGLYLYLEDGPAYKARDLLGKHRVVHITSSPSPRPACKEPFGWLYGIDQLNHKKKADYLTILPRKKYLDEQFNGAFYHQYMMCLLGEHYGQDVIIGSPYHDEATLVEAARTKGQEFLLSGQTRSISHKMFRREILPSNLHYVGYYSEYLRILCEIAENARTYSVPRWRCMETLDSFEMVPEEVANLLVGFNYLRFMSMKGTVNIGPTEEMEKVLKEHYLLKVPNDDSPASRMMREYLA